MQAKEIIEIVFIPIYLVLFLLALFSFISHGRSHRASFGLLFLFPLIRFVGNVLVVSALQEEKSSDANIGTIKSLFIAGYILEFAGFGILLGSAIALTTRICSSSTSLHQQESRGDQERGLTLILRSPLRHLQIANTVGTILLIVGLSKSASLYDGSGNGSVNSVAKAGVIIMLASAIILFLLIVYHRVSSDRMIPAAHTTLLFVGTAAIPMIARLAWSTYCIYSSRLLNANVWAQLVLQYLCECVATSILIALAFILHSNENEGRSDDVRPEGVLRQNLGEQESMKEGQTKNANSLRCSMFRK